MALEFDDQNKERRLGVKHCGYMELIMKYWVYWQEWKLSRWKENQVADVFITSSWRKSVKFFLQQAASWLQGRDTTISLLAAPTL